MGKPNQSVRVSLSRRAVLGRLNRNLRKQDKVLKRCREASRSHDCLGDYYLLDTYRNVILDRKIDLEDMARSNGVLQPYEELAD